MMRAFDDTILHEKREQWCQSANTVEGSQSISSPRKKQKTRKSKTLERHTRKKEIKKKK